MPVSAYKQVWATALDANTADRKEELGILRNDVNGVTYQYVVAGATGWETGKALIEATPGTPRILIPSTVGVIQPVKAVSQSTVTALYYGWVIKLGPCSVYTEGCGQGDSLFAGGVTAGYARVMPKRGAKDSPLRACTAGANGALASAEMR